MVAYVKWFEDLGRGDTLIAGGKGANLGEMTRAGLPVPPGFVVTTQAYRAFLDAHALGSRIDARIRSLDADDPTALAAASSELQSLIHQSEVPESVRKEIVGAYADLARRSGTDAPLVAVRSSGTAEDTAKYSFAGMFVSFLNVHGADDLVERVKECWASGFGARVLFYRIKQGLVSELLIGVIVQRMVQSERSGVLFTVDPATGNRDLLVIEAAWGLGEVVVGGKVEPDRYVVDKRTMRIVERAIGHKAFMLVRDEHGVNARVPLPPERADAAVLTDDMIRRLAELGIRDEQHYQSPQDAEFAIEGDQVYIVQTRPVTTLTPQGEPAAGPTKLVQGLGASPGLAVGPVKILRSPAEGASLRQGDVLVAAMTSPDWVPLMRRAAAIVTDGGGMTSHAAIVSRELGVPCIVGTRRATSVLKDGLEVTVDATEGVVYEGRVDRREPQAARSAAAAIPARPAMAPAPLVTATKLYVNLAEPERAEEVARLAVDGVGLLRAEFMITSALDNIHPQRLLEEGKTDQFVDRLVQQVVRFARAFQPRPVIYRTMDFRTNEFRGLVGGEDYEPIEANPMLGFRGCYRYVKDPALFRLELRAIRQVREEFDNLHLMIPFVRTGWEFNVCKKVIDEVDWGARRPEIWVMAEVPSIVTWLPDYVAAGVSGVSIGSNDLTQLVLGVDRDSEVMAPLFDERDRAVLEVIRTIIQTCQQLGVSCSICGQAPSVYPEFVEKLIRWGIDSISVNADVIERTRWHIAAAEQRLLLEKARTTATAAFGEAGHARQAIQGPPYPDYV